MYFLSRRYSSIFAVLQIINTLIVIIFLQLFTGPASHSAPAQEHGDPALLNTLDEPIMDTIKRDVIRIYKNLVMVVFPIEDRRQQHNALKNWDLWGPMLFTLGLAIPLSIGAAKPSSTFSLVFGLISIGASVLTVNVVLLGGSIGFFQSLCLLGYCLFPLNIAAIIFLFVHNSIARWIIMPLAVLWASWASVPFVGGAVSKDRRALAIYPLGLLYTTIGWLALIK